MKIYRFGIFFVFAAVMLATVICKPQWLADNNFLKEFISSEIVAVLIVILTITFASVANIQFALNRIEYRLGKEIKSKIVDIRGELNSDAWIIFWGFIVCISALVLKGAFENIHVQALANAIALIVLLLNVLVMHAIYRSLFALIHAESILKIEADKNKNIDVG
jgi:hypothetical protein